MGNGNPVSSNSCSWQLDEMRSAQAVVGALGTGGGKHSGEGVGGGGSV